MYVCAAPAGGASSMIHQASLATEANIPFWLQLVGSGITTSWAGHFGAVLEGAKWPAITAMNSASAPQSPPVSPSACY